MRSVIEAAPAKINLYLDIESKRPDGYHNIISVMHTVGLSDIITIDSASAGGIHVICDDPAVPGGAGNIAYRAAELYLSMAGISAGLRINIQKNIPSAAGLGGGSSDAAAVLRALNKIYGGHFSYEGLCRMGLRLGADVPFCVAGGCALVRGVGEIIEKQPKMPMAYIVICRAGRAVSTQDAYAELDAIYGDFTDRQPLGGEHIMNAAIAAGDIAGVCCAAYNIFEDCILPGHREAVEVREIMLASGAGTAMMSGSGPAVFGIFTDENRAALAAHGLEERGYTARICTPADTLRV